MTSDAASEIVTGSVAEEVCGALSGVLHNGVDIHRCLAAQALGRIGDDRAVEPLIGSLLDEDEDVRTDVAGALSALADPRSAGQLMENLLGDPCTDVKLAAIDALVRLEESDVVPWLRKLIHGRDEDIAWDDSEFFENGWDDWVDIQIKAIEGLAELGIAEAIPDMIDAMEDENAQELSGIVFKSLARLGDPGVDALAGFLEDPDERRRRRAIAALAGLKGEKVTALLTEALEDTAPMVRLAALQALAERDARASNLASVFDDESSEVRAEAVRLLGAAHSELLQELLDDEAADVQMAVMGVLIELPKLGNADALAALLRGKFDDPDPQMVLNAAMTLAEITPEESFKDLTALLADFNRPVEARIGALRGLSRINTAPAVAAIIGIIADRERPLRVEAMAA
ncbi:MAG: HEAT repeat domain-containing protein, partial [Alphaproteobacteria bacterium]|nr:HEAT repeat domain-containing protein [Alphaproteobacteria bacterium]